MALQARRMSSGYGTAPGWAAWGVSVMLLGWIGPSGLVLAQDQPAPAAAPGEVAEEDALLDSVQAVVQAAVGDFRARLVVADVVDDQVRYFRIRFTCGSRRPQQNPVFVLRIDP
jgi:hypothetical protein